MRASKRAGAKRKRSSSDFVKELDSSSEVSDGNHSASSTYPSEDCSLSRFQLPSDGYSACQHASAINGRQALTNAKKPHRWRCFRDDCRTTTNLLVCLRCGRIACGRDAGGHMAGHFASQRDHCITIDLNSGAVFCYLCDDWVHPSLANPAVQEIQSALAGLREPVAASSAAAERGELATANLGSLTDPIAAGIEVEPEASLHLEPLAGHPKRTDSTVHTHVCSTRGSRQSTGKAQGVDSTGRQVRITGNDGAQQQANRMEMQSQSLYLDSSQSGMSTAASSFSLSSPLAVVDDGVATERKQEEGEEEEGTGGRVRGAASGAATDAQDQTARVKSGVTGLHSTLSQVSLAAPRRSRHIVPLSIPSDVRETEVEDILTTLQARRYRRILLAAFGAISLQAQINRSRNGLAAPARSKRTVSARLAVRQRQPPMRMGSETKEKEGEEKEEEEEEQDQSVLGAKVVVGAHMRFTRGNNRRSLDTGITARTGKGKRGSAFATPAQLGASASEGKSTIEGEDSSSGLTTTEDENEASDGQSSVWTTDDRSSDREMAHADCSSDREMAHANRSSDREMAHADCSSDREMAHADCSSDREMAHANRPQDRQRHRAGQASKPMHSTASSNDQGSGSTGKTRSATSSSGSGSGSGFRSTPGMQQPLRRHLPLQVLSAARRRGAGRSKPLPGLLPGRTGLTNLGNSCYMAATVQALSYASPIRRYFLHAFCPVEFAKNVQVRSVSPKSVARYRRRGSIVVPAGEVPLLAIRHDDRPSSTVSTPPALGVSASLGSRDRYSLRLGSEGPSRLSPTALARRMLLADRDGESMAKTRFHQYPDDGDVNHGNEATYPRTVIGPPSLPIPAPMLVDAGSAGVLLLSAAPRLQRQASRDVYSSMASRPPRGGNNSDQPSGRLHPARAASSKASSGRSGSTREKASLKLQRGKRSKKISLRGGGRGTARTRSSQQGSASASASSTNLGRRSSTRVVKSKAKAQAQASKGRSPAKEGPGPQGSASKAKIKVKSKRKARSSDVLLSPSERASKLRTPKKKPGRFDSTIKRRAVASLRSVRATKAHQVVDVEPADRSLCVQFHRLLRLLWKGKWAAISPWGFRKAIWRFLPEFRSYQQQDAQEFVVALLNALHEELRRGGAAPGSELGLSSTDPVSHSAFLRAAASPRHSNDLPPPLFLPMVSTGKDEDLVNAGSGSESIGSDRAVPGDRVNWSGSKIKGKGEGKALSLRGGTRLRYTSVRPRSSSRSRRAPDRISMDGAGESNGQSATGSQSSAKKRRTDTNEKDQSQRAPAAAKRGAGPSSRKRPQTRPLVDSESIDPSAQTTAAETDDGRPAVTFELEDDDGSLMSRIPLFHPSEFIGGTLFGSTAAETTCASCRTVSRREHEFVCLSVDIDEAKEFADPEGDESTRAAASQQAKTALEARHALRSAADSLASRLPPGPLDASLDESLDLDAAGSPPRARRTTIGGMGGGSCEGEEDDDDAYMPPSTNSNARMLAMLGSIDSPAAGTHSRRKRPSRSGQVPVTLEACLRKACNPSSLDGDNQYHCDECGGKRDAQRRELLSQLPPVLTVHLSRAFWTARGKTKSQIHVDFPMDGLDLGNFCSAHAAAKANPRAGEFQAASKTASTPHRDVAAQIARLERGTATPGNATPASDGVGSSGRAARVPMYHLASVVVHHGRGIDKGHYTCYCFDTERDVWLHFDDSKVTVCTPQDVAKSQAYLLVYVRSDAL